MVPRTKVNYGLWEVFRALTIGAGETYGRRLAEQIREKLGDGQVLLTPSGRGSLFFILKSLPHIHRVLVPAYTCKAVVEAALLAEKEVMYCEVDADTFNMDVSLLNEPLDAQTAIIATHQYGIACDMRSILDIAHRYGCLVIEDVAAALGTIVDGRQAGTWGEISFFSFDSTKLINVPMKGGFIYTPNQALYQSLSEGYEAYTVPMPISRKLINLLKAALFVLLENHRLYLLFHYLEFGRKHRFTNDQPGVNLQLTEFYRYRFAEWQAFFAVRQFDQLDAIIAKRKRVYAEFYERLIDSPYFLCPPKDPGDQWCCVRFPVRIPSGKLKFYETCVEKGVDLAFSFTYIAPPATSYPLANQLADEVVNLPFYNKLTQSEFETVINVLKTIAGPISRLTTQS